MKAIVYREYGSPDVFRVEDIAKPILINGAGGSIGTFAVQIAKDMGAEVTAVDSGIEDGKIKSTVDRVFPMERIAEAHRRVETEHRRGSVVISL